MEMRKLFLFVVINSLFVYDTLSQEIAGNWFQCQDNGEYVEYLVEDSTLLITKNNYAYKTSFYINNDTLYYRYSHQGSESVHGIFLFRFLNDTTVLANNYYLSEWNKYEVTFSDTLKQINKNTHHRRRTCFDLRTKSQKEYDSLQEARIQELELRLLELEIKSNNHNKKKN